MVIFFGPAGSGKSIQGRMLASLNGWTWLSMGQLLRATSDQEIHKLITDGKFVPTDKTNEILITALKGVEDCDKLIIDGYPRYIDQAKWLADNQSKYGYKLRLALVIDVPKQELLRRLSLRGRADDTSEVIEKRLTSYDQETCPVFDFLIESGIKTIHIDGVGSVDQVHERIVEELSGIKLS